MMKKYLPYILIVALILFGLIFLDRSFRSSAALVKARAEAAEAKRVDAADDQIRDAIEAEQNAVIAVKTAKIAALLANVGKPTPAEKAKDAEITELKRKMAESEGSGNAAQALAEAKQVIAALEAGKFSLAQSHKADMFSLDAAWQMKFNALQAISDARLVTIGIKNKRIIALENLCSEYVHTIKLNKFWVAVGKYGPPISFVGGLIAGK
jgi:hypothetical protein